LVLALLCALASWRDAWFWFWAFQVSPKPYPRARQLRAGKGLLCLPVTAITIIRVNPHSSRPRSGPRFRQITENKIKNQNHGIAPRRKGAKETMTVPASPVRTLRPQGYRLYIVFRTIVRPKYALAFLGVFAALRDAWFWFWAFPFRSLQTLKTLSSRQAAAHG
jgi:hypothetical protein